MNFNNFTIKAQDVVQKAVQLTRANGNQAVEPEHLLKALMLEGDAVVRFIFQKLDINPANVERPLDAALQKLPRVSGGEPYLGNDGSKVLEKANDILGYRITDIMFEGTDEDLKQTKVTQPAVFLHSVISAICMGDKFQPEMTAGHSLGEFSALVAAGALSFEDGLKLVYARAMAMQKACEAQPSTMAAIIGLPDEKVEEVCTEVSKLGKGVVVPANYNNPGQLVISGNIDAVNEACEQLKAAGAKRALPLKVGGAFHSPLMQPAKDELQAAIEKTEFQTPKCPVYQNVDAKPHTDAAEIKQNLIAQLTSSVRWTQIVQNMIADGAADFTECGPGKALQGMIAKINKDIPAHGIE